MLRPEHSQAAARKKKQATVDQKFGFRVSLWVYIQPTATSHRHIDTGGDNS